MSPTAQTILAFFTLLLFSVGTFLLARKVRLPYTVLLVLVGLLLIPLSRTDTFAYLLHFQLTPDILFLVFLPILIFESAYNMNLSDIGENIWSISVLSVVSLAISAFFIAFAGQWALRAIGIEVPFIVLLLFGALISSTDPVAVLALFKEFGAPKRLSLIFEGESLFNDGTALALFLVVLDAALKSFQGLGSIIDGAFIFTTMMVGGILFGFVMGAIFSRLLEYVRHEHLQLTISLAAAHLTFLLSELISNHLVVFGQQIRFSSIIATALASIVVGAESRYRISPAIRQYMDRFWGYAAFVANSLVFILMGLIFSTLHLNIIDIPLPLAVIIVVVIVGRVLSVYPVIGVLNALKVEAPIPRSWQKLLAWGSFRGALAVMMVLLIPDNYLPEGWNLEPSAKAFIMALTIGCIYFTLFIKATTMNGVLRRFRLKDMEELENIEYQQGKVYVYAHSLLHLMSLEGKAYVEKAALDTLRAKYAALYQQACSAFAHQAEGCEAALARVLRIHAIGIEKRTVSDLFGSGALSEKAYRRISAKLDLQLKLLESGEYAAPDKNEAAGWWISARKRFGLPRRSLSPTDEYLYYRALAIAAHEVTESLGQLAKQESFRLIKADTVFSGILDLYRNSEARAMSHARDLITNHQELESEQLGLLQQDLHKAQNLSLLELEDSNLITPKVKSALAEELCD